ncbi:MAG: hypothetical protein KDN19_20780 [Verrucomicrobiae bacterium]|nr:hypothetical protein [Verrucomicrobiae bacterium]
MRSIPALILTAVTVALLLPPAARAAGSGWERADDTAIEGDLVRFDFEAKKAVFGDEEGRLEEIPTEELSADSRWRLLMSPVFARSFPSDRWTPEQTRYLTYAIAGPVIFLLISFWICAAILFKTANPIRAVAGWVGSALLGGFLMGFYLVLSGRSPGSATGILIGGSLVSLVLLSLYVSAIYQVTTVEGFKLLVFHLFGAFFFLALTLLTIRQLTHSFDLEPIVREHVMIPVGIISDN